MKKGKRKGGALTPADLAVDFTRGVVVTGLLAAIQDRWAGGEAPSRQKVLKLAVQGGAALVAGVAASESLRRRDYASALIALAGGAAGVTAAEILFASHPLKPAEDKDNG